MSGDQAAAADRDNMDASKLDATFAHSLKDARAYALMMGVGETYLSAFAIFLKATTPQIGLLASLPPLIGSFAQILSAWLGRVTGARKSLMLAGAGLQAGAWLPIMFLPLAFPDAAVPCLIAAVIMYYCGAHLAAPQWASLMGDLIPPRRRGRFFARRTRIVALVTFFSLAAAGGVLDFASGSGYTLAGFLVLFVSAMIARSVSTWHLAQMHDPGAHVDAPEPGRTASVFSRLRKSGFARFSLFFALMQFSVAIASPFFSVYMLRDLGFSYAQFMANIGMSSLAQFLTLTQWGRISDVFGNRRILSATGVMLPMLPLLWILSPDFWYLLVVQLVSGAAWAGFTLSASNFLYELTTRENRATWLAMHNVLAATGIFLGAILGGYLGLLFPASIRVPLLDWFWLSPIIGVFAVSALARSAVAAILLPRIREVRKVRPISFSRLIFRVTRMNALAGIVFDIIGTRPRTGPPPTERTGE
jgi:MFS family permease